MTGEFAAGRIAMQVFDGKHATAQTRKVAANQAFLSISPRV